MDTSPVSVAYALGSMDEERLRLRSGSSMAAFTTINVTGFVTNENSRDPSEIAEEFLSSVSVVDVSTLVSGTPPSPSLAPSLQVSQVGDEPSAEDMDFWESLSDVSY